MRISSDRTVSGVVEQLYQQNAPAPQNQEVATSQPEKENVQAAVKQRAVIEDVNHVSLLSGSELEALDLLFGSGTGGNGFFYGNNKIQNVQQGFLLDIRG